MTTLIFYGFSVFLILAAAGVVLCRNPVHGVLCLIAAFFNGASLCLFLGAEFIAMVLVIVYVGAVAVLFLFAVMMIDMSITEKPKVFSILSLSHRVRSIGFFLRDASIHLFLALMIALVLEWGLEGANVILGSYSIAVKMCIWGASFILARIFLAPFFKQSLWERAKIALKSLPLAAIIGGVLGAEFISVIWHWPHNPIWGAGSATVATVTNTHQIGRILYTDYMFAFQSVGVILLIAMIGAITLTLRPPTTRRIQNPKDQMNRRREDSVELRNMPIGGGV